MLSIFLSYSDIILIQCFKFTASKSNTTLSSIELDIIFVVSDYFFILNIKHNFKKLRNNTKDTAILNKYALNIFASWSSQIVHFEDYLISYAAKKVGNLAINVFPPIKWNILKDLAENWTKDTYTKLHIRVLFIIKIN